MQDRDISIADVVIEAMPFSDEIITWCHAHPEFKDALKITNADRFQALGMVLTSRPKNRPSDFVIGFVAYDMQAQKFKQDFIVDVGNAHNEFMLYTKLPSGNYEGKYVHHINQFFAIYGKDGNYAKTHHFDLQYLRSMGNQELTERAERAVRRSQQIIQFGGLRPISQSELKAALDGIRAEKAKLNVTG